MLHNLERRARHIRRDWWLPGADNPWSRHSLEQTLSGAAPPWSKHSLEQTLPGVDPPWNRPSLEQMLPGASWTSWEEKRRMYRLISSLPAYSVVPTLVWCPPWHAPSLTGVALLKNKQTNSKTTDFPFPSSFQMKVTPQLVMRLLGGNCQWFFLIHNTKSGY